MAMASVRSGAARAAARLATLGFFPNVPAAPADPILGVAQAFKADTNPNKVNVGVGAYRDESGKPWVLPSVRTAEDRIHAARMDHEYSPIEGDATFLSASIKLAYGADSAPLQEGRVAACQSLSGTGALRLVAGYLARFPPTTDGSLPVVVVPNPTWSNHFQIFEHAGLKVQQYRYWDPTTLGLDLKGMLDDLNALPARSVVVLHACAHNPTGVDPTHDQWKQIEEVCRARDLFVVFDSAYQGFASGDPDHDAFAVRHFVAQGHNVALCQSFAKNFGLYGERVGAMSIVCNDKDECARVLSQVKVVARAMYSNPAIYGSRIVSTVLNDKGLEAQWRADIVTMSARIKAMRQRLVDELKKAGSTRDWSHLTNQIGMFSFTGMNKQQCERLTNEFHIYLTLNGRISMAGVTEGNVAYLARAIHEVTK